MKWYKTNNKSGGAWENASTWNVSTDAGANWSPATDYPNGTNVDSIIIEKPVTLHKDETANNLYVSSAINAVLDLGSYTLSLIGNAAIDGNLWSTINSNTSYGKILSNTAGKINVYNTNLTLNAGVSTTEPTSTVDYDIIFSTTAIVTLDPTSNTIIPLNLWEPLQWGLGYGTHSLTLTYNGTVTSLNTPKLAKAYAVNGKLIYSDGAVYNAMGAKVASGIGRQEVALTSGVYIVKSATGVQKVFVK